MRWLTGLVVVLACLWCGYWFVGSSAFEKGAAKWFVNMEAAGKTARYEGLAVQGFPNRFDLTVTAPEIADPASGIGWQAPFLQILSLSYKPWHVIAAFPNAQRITLPQGAMTLEAGKLQASVVAQPKAALPLDRMVLVGNDLVAVGDAGWDVRAASLNFATRLDESRVDTHELGLEVKNLQPDAQLMELLRGSLPDNVALIRADATAAFTAPIDRFTLKSQPRIAALDLAELRIEWGDMTVTAKGKVVADAAGFAEGDLVLRLENWRVALDVAEMTGLIPMANRKLWDRAVGLLAFGSDGRDAIELPLQFRGGKTLVGPIPVGPAPRLRYLQ